MGLIGVNMRLAQVERIDLVESTPARPSRPGGGWLEFASYLARKYSITGDLLSKFDPTTRSGGQQKLRDLWELTDLSANDFADEVARFFALPRLNLPQLFALPSLGERFSRRFLR